MNGQLIDESKASVSIHNLGLQRGFGIFDLFRGREGRPVFLPDHLARFDGSQKFLGISQPIPLDEIRQAVDDLQKKNGFEASTFRLMLLGDGKDSDEVIKPFFYITNTDFSHYENPEAAGVMLHDYVREYPKIKTTNYFTSFLLHQKKKALNAIDVIYHHKDIVSEASRSNVFIVKDGVLFTPDENILEGITRKHLLKIAEDILPVNIEPITTQQLIQSDEIFLTGTLKEVLPIVKVDGQRIGRGKAGPITSKLQSHFKAYLHDYSVEL